MMFKSTKDQYGFGLQQPEQSDYELYKRLWESRYANQSNHKL